MAAKILKYFLGILSDATFLSSIEYFDFKNRYISIRRDFFNLCFSVASSNEKIYKPRRLGSILKELFLQRFTTVSSSNLKKYFDNKISNCFIDFLNIARYYSALLQDDKIDFHKFFKNYLNKRNFRFYEKKGFKYYQYFKSPEFNKIKSSNDDKQQQQNLVDNKDSISKPSTLQHIRETFEDISKSDDGESVTSELASEDYKSVTSEDIRRFLAEEEEFQRNTNDQLHHMYNISEPNHFHQIQQNSDPREVDYLAENNLYPSMYGENNSNNFEHNRDLINDRLASNIQMNRNPDFGENSLTNNPLAFFEQWDSHFANRSIQNRQNQNRTEINRFTNNILESQEEES
jgi:hypothetical protein